MASKKDGDENHGMDNFDFDDGFDAFPEDQFENDKFLDSFGSEESPVVQSNTVLDKKTKDGKEPLFKVLLERRDEDPENQFNPIRQSGSNLILCGFQGASGLVTGAITGTCFGMFSGLYEGYRMGLAREKARFGMFVLNHAKSQGLRFGSFLATYAAASCTIKHYRGGERDWVSTFGGGLAAGMVGSLPTRNPVAIAMSGVLAGGFMLIFNGVEKNTVPTNIGSLTKPGKDNEK